jgi:hypothetical protein
MIKRPEFKSGNKWMVEALNLVAEYAQRTGVNPGGRPGWSETAQGWLPPYNKGGGEMGEFRWDLINSTEEGEWTLFDPKVVYSREDIESDVVINNDPFTLAADYWVVAKMEGPVNDFIAAPTITIEALDTWSGFPSAYKFGSAPSSNWEVTRIPIYKIEALGENEDKTGTVSVGDGLYATKLVSHYPTLAFTLATVPNEDRTRVVPTLL